MRDCSVQKQYNIKTELYEFVLDVLLYLEYYGEQKIKISNYCLKFPDNKIMRIYQVT